MLRFAKEKLSLSDPTFQALGNLSGSWHAGKRYGLNLSTVEAEGAAF